MSFRRRALFLAGLFVAVSCSDAGNPIGPEGPETPATPDPGEVLATLTCRVSVSNSEMVCAPPTPGVGPASGLIIGGSNGDYVRLTKIGHNVDADSMWFGVTLQNLIHQTLGTTDGVTPHVDGIRIYFSIEPWMVAPGSVEVIPDGTHFFTAAGQQYYQYAGMLADSAVSAPTTWKFKRKDINDAPTAFVNGENFEFTVRVAAAVKYPQGWIDITPDNPVLEEGGAAVLTAQIRTAFGRFPVGPPPDSAQWSSSDPSVVTVAELTDTTASITGVNEGTAWVYAESRRNSVRRDSVLVTVDNAPIVPDETMTALMNVRTSLPDSVLLNNVPAGATLKLDTTYTTAHGRATIDATGGLSYASTGGYTGVDTIFYKVSDSHWTVSGRVVVDVKTSNYWFVQPGATNGEGSNTKPFATLAEAVAAAAADTTVAADSIFVLRNGSMQLVGATTLEANQRVIGQGLPVGYQLTRTPNGTRATDVVFEGLGTGTELAATDAPTLTLDANNTVSGLNITSVRAAAIHGVGFGTLAVDSGTVMVEADGPALSLQNGTVSGVFFKLASTGSDSSALHLVNVGGRVVTMTGTISGAATTAISVTSGSTVDLTYPDNVSHGGTGQLLDVSSHSGTMEFNGTLSATGGTGIRFSSASGTYAFNGAVNLAGGDAGLDVLSSGGVFSFADASITNPSGGPAVNVVGGSPALVYRGSITHNSGRAVLVDGITADSVILRAAITSGTGASPTGLGILVQNVSGGRVALDSVKTLFTGGNPAVTLTGNTGGLVRFGGGMDITTTTGAGFTASGTDTVIVTGNNTVSTGTGVPVSLTSVSTGASGVSFSNVSTSTGAANGIVLNGITGAGFQSTGGGISATTGATVLLTNTNGADSVSLRGMTLGRSGAGAHVVSGTTFGKLHLLNTTLTGGSGAGALSLNGGTLSGSASGLTALGASTSPVSLTNVGGSLSVTAGNLSVAVGGSGAAMDVSGGTVNLTYTGDLTGLAATPLLRVANGHTGTLALNGGNSTAGTGSPGLRFENADGTYNVSVTAGTTTLAGDSAGIDILPGTDGTNGSQGTFQFGTSGNPVGIAISSGAGTAFNFQGSAADVTFHGGITKNASQTGRMVDITGQRAASSITFQTGTLSATSNNAGSTGILLNDADGTVAFSGTTTLGNVAITTGDAGIDVENGSSGTITFAGSSSVVNAAGELIRIVNSAPTFTYPGTFQRTTGSAIGILAQGNTGGTITFNGDGTTLDGDPADVTKSLSTGTANAVSLVTNTGTTFHFAGGMTLATTSGTTFNATGGGTVNVSGAGNTVNATSGTGVRITDTDIGATSGVVFRSVTASGGANGIFLQNTGNTGGGFGVMGDGSTVGSGGTIQGTTGGDGSTGGVGVYLNNTRNVVLHSIISTNHQNFGIQGQTVSGFTLNNSRMHGTHGTNVGFDESVVSIAELTGVALFTNDSISGGVEDNVRILNTTGTLDSLVFNNVRMGHMDATQGNDALLVRVQDAAVVKARIRNSTFHGARGDMVQFNIVNSGNGDLAMTGNTFNNTHANIVSGVGGITLSGGGAGSTPKLRYTITGNTFRGSRGTMLLISKGVGTADYAGTVENNVFGQSGIGAGVNNTTSTEASAINFVLYGGGTHTTRVNNNQIFGYNNYGILMESGDHTGGGGGHGTLNATITNNTIAEPGSFAFPQQGIHLNLGLITDDAATACVNATGNSLNDSGDSQDIRLRQRMKTKVVLPGYGGSISDNTAVNNFVKANNGNAASLVVAASNSVGLAAPDGPGQGFTNGSCPLP